MNDQQKWENVLLFKDLQHFAQLMFTGAAYSGGTKMK